MRRYTAKLSCALVLLLLTACTGGTQTKAADAPAPSSPQPTAAATVLDGAPATFRYDRSQLALALPMTYRGRTTDRFDYFIDMRTLRPRDDPWAGQPVAPESCRQSVLTSGISDRGIDGFRSDTPSVAANVMPPTPIGDGLVSVRLYELVGDEAVRYQLQIPRPVPECREFTVGSAGRGSIVERPVAEFGPRSRYIVRTYPRNGRVWIERILQLQTPHFAVDARIYGLGNPEPEFLAFVRQTRDRAVRQLG